MGIRNRLHRLDSGNRHVRIFGYVVCASLAVVVLGAIFYGIDLDDGIVESISFVQTEEGPGGGGEDKDAITKEPQEEYQEEPDERSLWEERLKKSGTDGRQVQRDFGAAEVTAETVYNAVDGKVGDEIEVSVDDLGRGKDVVVTSMPAFVLGESTLVKKTAWDCVDVFEVLFANPGVKRVRIVQQAVFIDEYGDEDCENAVMVEMNRATADKINWDSLRHRVYVDPNALFNAADDYSIHPAVHRYL